MAAGGQSRPRATPLDPGAWPAMKARRNPHASTENGCGPRNWQDGDNVGMANRDTFFRPRCQIPTLANKSGDSNGLYAENWPVPRDKCIYRIEIILPYPSHLSNDWMIVWYSLIALPAGLAAPFSSSPSLPRWSVAQRRRSGCGRSSAKWSAQGWTGGTYYIIVEMSY